MNNTLKPWRTLAIPHDDVMWGSFQQAEFAADITSVHEGTATSEYQDPSLFFQRTFITEGMRLLLNSVIKRLVGRGGDPVIQLQTAFGGGKTHTMLAVYHLANGKTPANQLLGIPQILNAAQVTELPTARIVVLDGIRLSPNQPQIHGNLKVNTIWGELAWQLGGVTAYIEVKDADLSGTSPGKGVLAQLLAEYAPCVILIDELVAYIRQFEEGKNYTGGSYDANLTFVQALTEAMKAVPTAVLLASLPASDKEAGSQRGIATLATLAHYFGRVQALWKPVATEEAFEIVRRRLFKEIQDPAAVEQICQAYMQYYAANSIDFPTETQSNLYLIRLQQAYPIHPELFDRLYEDWSALDNFQRTRGVLKLMAKVIHRLWKDNNPDPFIQPGNLPLNDNDTRNEILYYLAQGWDPVLEKDIDGDRAESTEMDLKEPRLGKMHIYKRLARSIFFGSAPDVGIIGSEKRRRGIELEQILLGCAQPEQSIGYYKEAVRNLANKLQYINNVDQRYWFDTRPNLRREMEDRKRRFDEKRDVFTFIKGKLRFAPGPFATVHVFDNSVDIPDDWALRLVILPPDTPLSPSGQVLTTAQARATEILEKRGEQPRQRRNRLLFLAAGADSINRLKDLVRSILAWQSIAADVKEERLNLDTLQRQEASKKLDEDTKALDRMIREVYKWLLTPRQEIQTIRGKTAPTEMKWEHFEINPEKPNSMQVIERIMRENELLITEWAPIHLAKLLKDLFWKSDAPTVKALDIWQKSCNYIYLPRFSSDVVLKNTLATAGKSREFFGVAYGYQDGRYSGFQFGSPDTPILNESLLLIEPKAAVAFEKLLADEEETRIATQLAATQRAMVENTTPPDYAIADSALDAVTIPPVAKNLQAPTAAPKSANPVTVPKKRSVAPTAPVVTTVSPASSMQTPVREVKKRGFYGTVALDSVGSKTQFNTIVDEIMSLLTQPGAKLNIALEIRAESTTGFDEKTQRAVQENCKQLRFRDFEFKD